MDHKRTAQACPEIETVTTCRFLPQVRIVGRHRYRFRYPDLLRSVALASEIPWKQHTSCYRGSLQGRVSRARMRPPSQKLRSSRSASGFPVGIARAFSLVFRRIVLSFNQSEIRPPCQSTRLQFVCASILFEGSIEIANSRDLLQIDGKKLCNGAVGLILVDMAAFM